MERSSEDFGGGRTIDEHLFEQIERRWAYNDDEESGPTKVYLRADHEGTGEQIRCCDCHQPFREPPTEGFRKLGLPPLWADCLWHPGFQHHAVCP